MLQLQTDKFQARRIALDTEELRRLIRINEAIPGFCEFTKGRVAACGRYLSKLARTKRPPKVYVNLSQIVYRKVLNMGLINCRLL